MAQRTEFRPHQVPSEAAITAYHEALRRFWHPVLPAADLADNVPSGAVLLDEPIVLARLDGRLVAMQDLCRHFQAQLSLGEIRRIGAYGDCLMCPYHGWSYAADGRCVDIPQLAPGRAVPSEARVPTYQVAERYGLIWVCLADQPALPLPELPMLDDPEFLSGPLRSYAPWAASAPRTIMAALDDTHGPWVHPGLVGDRTDPTPPEHQVRREGACLVVELRMRQPDNPAIAEGRRAAGPREVRITTTVWMPNVIHFQIRAADNTDGRCTVIWQAVSPRAYNQTATFWGSARNYERDQPAWNDAFEAMQDTLREQDRRIVESQRPWLLPPFWTRLELPLRPADLPLIGYQQWLEELGITTEL